MINKINNLINFQKSINPEVKKFKIVMTPETSEKLSAEVPDDIILSLQEDKYVQATLFGYPIEINDKIATDVYVTEIL